MCASLRDGHHPATLVQVTFGVGSERVAVANARIISGSERNDEENRRAKIPGSSPAAIIKFKREALLNVVRKCKVELADAQVLAVAGHRLQPLAIVGGDFNLLLAAVKPVVTEAMSHFNSKNFDGLTSAHAAETDGRDWIFSTGGIAEDWLTEEPRVQPSRRDLRLPTFLADRCDPTRLTTNTPTTVTSPAPTTCTPAPTTS